LNNLRIATFNLENLDDKPGKKPTLAERISVMRPQLLRLKADILCLQEVNGQETEGQPRRLLALERLVEGTPYADYFVVSTKTEDGKQVYDERNLVILSSYEIVSHQQYKHDYAPAPRYQKVTARTTGSGSGGGRRSKAGDLGAADPPRQGSGGGRDPRLHQPPPQVPKPLQRRGTETLKLIGLQYLGS